MKKKIYLVIDNQIKQMIRELEHRMSSLETLDCLAFLSGNGSKNRGFRDVWKKMLFAMFHDAITGTHVDAAYAELMEVLFRAKQEMMELTGEILAILQAAEETSRVVFNMLSPKFLFLPASASKVFSLRPDRLFCWKKSSKGMFPVLKYSYPR